MISFRIFFPSDFKNLKVQKFVLKNNMIFMNNIFKQNENVFGIKVVQ